MDFFQLVTLGFLVVALLALWQLSRIGSVLEQVRDALHRDEVRSEVRQTRRGGENRDA